MLGLLWDAAKGILFSPSVKGVVGQLADLYLRRAATDDDAERAEIDAQVKVLELQAEALAHEQKWWATAWIRPAFAFIVFLYYAKILVWDKVLGLGATDDLNETQFWVASAVIGAYFIVRPFEKIFRR